MKRIGIFGGTFDPPHKGHYMAAIQFLERAKLDELLIIPTYQPPHKNKISTSTPADRLNMSKITFSDLDKVKVSDLEIARGGKSYTYLTLEELSNPGTELYLLCGTDMFLTLDSWRNSDKIFNLATICYIRRENDTNYEAEINIKAQTYVDKLGAKIMYIEAPALVISSTEIREAIKDKKETDALHPLVYEYITERGLYL